MATIKAVVRNARADGFLPVYIRIVHKSKPGYIKTDKIVSPKGIYWCPLKLSSPIWLFIFLGQPIY